ncbi:MAG: serine/threonine protein kinase [Candidatus Obscuribacterales bacterium]|nr:serine/threonine protein kinase [Candidatus Obscuribacterales bacterium]
MLTVGSIFEDRYEILAVLGEGGMGTVYKSKQMDVKRIIALKVMHGVDVEDDESIRRFRREAKALSRLQHRNIVTFYHYGFAKDGTPFAAMEYLKGKNLAVLLEEAGPIEANRSATIMMQILAALSEAHAQGIVHRDLKPANIMLLDKPEKDTVKLVDFGLAKLAQKPGLASGKLTKTGMLIGSVHYMSPEQVAGQTVDARSDLYSCGCIMYEMLTGTKPFEAENPVGLMYLHANQKAASFSSHVATRNASPTIEAICFRAMEKDPLERYQNADEFAQDLDAFLNKRSIKSVIKPAASGMIAKSKVWTVFLTIALFAFLIIQSGYFDRTKEAEGVASFISIEPLAGNNFSIRELHLDTENGLLKLDGRGYRYRLERAAYDGFEGLHCAVKYRSDHGSNLLVDFRPLFRDASLSGAFGSVANYLCHLRNGDYGNAYDVLSPRLQERRYGGCKRFQLEIGKRKFLKLDTRIVDGFEEEVPQKTYKSRNGSVSILPHFYKLGKHESGKAEILVNKIFYSSDQGFEKFILLPPDPERKRLILIDDIQESSQEEWNKY